MYIIFMEPCPSFSLIHHIFLKKINKKQSQPKVTHNSQKQEDRLDQLSNT